MNSNEFESFAQRELAPAADAMPPWEADPSAIRPAEIAFAVLGYADDNLADRILADPQARDRVRLAWQQEPPADLWDEAGQDATTATARLLATLATPVEEADRQATVIGLTDYRGRRRVDFHVRAWERELAAKGEDDDVSDVQQGPDWTVRRRVLSPAETLITIELAANVADPGSLVRINLAEGDGQHSYLLVLGGAPGEPGTASITSSGDAIGSFELDITEIGIQVADLTKEDLKLVQSSYARSDGLGQEHWINLALVLPETDPVHQAVTAAAQRRSGPSDD